MPVDHRELAKRLTSYVEAAREQLNSASETWEVLACAARNQPIGGQIDLMGGDYQRCMPLIQPRVKQLVAYIAGPMFSVTPFFAAKPYGSVDRAEEVENAVQFMMERADASRIARKALNIAAIAEPAIINAWYEDHDDEDDEPPKICLDVLHPTDFRIYPLSAGCVKKARFVAKKVFLPVAEIKEKLKESGQPSQNVQGGDLMFEDNAARDESWAGTAEDSFFALADHELVECYSGLCRDEVFGDEDWHKVLVAPKHNLCVETEFYGAEIETTEYGDNEGETTITRKQEKIGYSRPWFFEQRLQEREQGEFYHSTPFARYALDLQRAYNDTWNLFYAGACMSAFGAGFTSARLPQNVIRFKPGEIWQVDGPVDIQWVNVGFRADVLPEVIAKLESITDSALRISQLGVSQQLKSGTTATEAAGLMQGQQSGIDEYREMAGYCWLELADWFRELIYVHWDEITSYYGEMFPGKNRENFAKCCVWQLVGKSDEANPKMLIDKYAALKQLAPEFGWNLKPLGDMILDGMNLGIDTSKIKQEATNGEIAGSGQLPVMGGASGMGMVPAMGQGEAGNLPADPGGY